MKDTSLNGNSEPQVGAPQSAAGAGNHSIHGSCSDEYCKTCKLLLSRESFSFFILPYSCFQCHETKREILGHIVKVAMPGADNEIKGRLALVTGASGGCVHHL